MVAVELNPEGCWSQRRFFFSSFFFESIPESDYEEQGPGKIENLGPESSLGLGNGKPGDQVSGCSRQGVGFSPPPAQLPPERSCLCSEVPRSVAGAAALLTPTEHLLGAHFKDLVGCSSG